MAVGEDGKEEDEEEEVYCLCKGPHDGRFMIQCEECEEWYHGSCVEISEAESKSIEKYYCTICISKNDQLAIVHKKTPPASAKKKGGAASIKKIEVETQPLRIDYNKMPRCGDCINCFRSEPCRKCEGCADGNLCMKLRCENAPEKWYEKLARGKKGRKSVADSDDDDHLKPRSAKKRKSYNKLPKPKPSPRNQRTEEEMDKIERRIAEPDSHSFTVDSIVNGAAQDRRIDVRTLEERTNDAKIGYNHFYSDAHAMPQDPATNFKDLPRCGDCISCHRSKPCGLCTGCDGNTMCIKLRCTNWPNPCMVCKAPCRPGSKYCSDACGLIVAQRRIDASGLATSYEAVLATTLNGKKTSMDIMSLMDEGESSEPSCSKDSDYHSST